MVRQSKIILALFNEFVYEHRGNNTYVIQEKTALVKFRHGGGGYQKWPAPLAIFQNEILEYSSQWAVVLLCFVQNALSKQ